MSKKKSVRGKKKPARKSTGHPARVSQAVISLNAARVEKALAAIALPWVRWFGAEHGAENEALDVLDLMALVFGAYLEVTGKLPPTDLNPDDLGRALGRLGETEEPEMLPIILDALLLYMEFLGQNRLWTGTPNDYQSLMGLLDQMMDLISGEVIFVIPELSLETELAAFQGIELFGRFVALTEWVGAGKPVTGTGVLRLKDIEAGAASVGVKARGATKGAVGGPGILLVRSMNDVPVLSSGWQLMLEAGILELESGTARVTAAGMRLVRGTDEEKLAEYRRLVSQFLRAWMLTVADIPALAQSLSTMIVAIFVGATTDEPFPVEDFPTLDPGAKAPGFDSSDFDVEGFLGTLALPRLEELAELGLFEIGTHFRIPPAFVRCYAEAFAEDFDVDIEYPENETRDDRDEPEIIPAPAASTGFKVYQLKIELVGSHPAIWRRVLVRSDTDFYWLHAVIQNVFGWDGSHMHSFYAGGRNRVQIGPPRSPHGSFWEDPEHNEDTTRLDEFLLRARSKATYVYDFGDNWEHQITVEKTSAPEEGQLLPRCIDGAGAGPEEDCGGVWGWAGLIEAVNDPKHPDHEDRLDWMGMEPGEVLDPTVFSVEDANEALAHLRSR